MLGVSGLGVYRSISIAQACSSESYTALEFPASALVNLTEGPMARYIDKYYPQGERHYGYMLSIETDENRGNWYSVNIKVSLTARDIWEGQRGLFCSKIDVLSQQINYSSSGEYIDSKNRKWTDTISEKEGLIHKVASYHFGANTAPFIAFRYRRLFFYSRIIIVATLIDKVTKEKRDILISHTDLLKGGDHCGGGVVLI